MLDYWTFDTNNIRPVREWQHSSKSLGDSDGIKLQLYLLHTLVPNFHDS